MVGQSETRTEIALGQLFVNYKITKIIKNPYHCCSGLTFPGGESGISVPDTLCTPKSVGISVDTNTYEPHLLAGTMAHMIGHNIGKQPVAIVALSSSTVRLHSLPGTVIFCAIHYARPEFRLSISFFLLSQIFLVIKA